jgi:hypothetical protein
MRANPISNAKLTTTKRRDDSAGGTSKEELVGAGHELVVPDAEPTSIGVLRKQTTSVRTNESNETQFDYIKNK